MTTEITHTGLCHFVDEQKVYGYLTTDYHETLFFHFRDTLGEMPTSGSRVIFNKSMYQGKPCATNVVRIDKIYDKV